MGLVHVYTGDGKGKTTAAFGLALRALGKGLNVLIVQFLKGKVTSGGEGIIKKAMPKNIKILRFAGEQHPIFIPSEKFDEKRLKEVIRRDFDRARRLVLKGWYDLAVLDEINNVINGGWLSVDEVKDLIKRRPKNVEIVLTGRDAPKEIIEMADYVTEMREIRHPSRKGIKARRGIEF